MAIGGTLEVGRKYGRRRIQSLAGADGVHQLYTVICECGCRQTVRGRQLQENESCGCLTKERHPTHDVRRGLKTAHPWYKTWRHMLERCYSPTHVLYHHYGARGITVCKRWRESFWAFVDDMSPKPFGRTLGRVDNRGPYSPKNCCWETPAERLKNLVERRKATLRKKQE